MIAAFVGEQRPITILQYNELVFEALASTGNAPLLIHEPNPTFDANEIYVCHQPLEHESGHFYTVAFAEETVEISDSAMWNFRAVAQKSDFLERASEHKNVTYFKLAALGIDLEELDCAGVAYELVGHGDCIPTDKDESHFTNDLRREGISTLQNVAAARLCSPLGGAVPHNGCVPAGGEVLICFLEVHSEGLTHFLCSDLQCHRATHSIFNEFHKRLSRISVRISSELC